MRASERPGQFFWSGACLAALLFACSSEPSKGSDANGGANGSGGNASAACPVGPGYGSNAAPQHVASVTAKLVDLDEQPVANELVQLCGLDICLSNKTTATGSVKISSSSPLKRPAFKPGEGLVTARFALLIPDSGDVDLGTVHTVRLPALDTGAELSPDRVASSGGLSIELPANGSAMVDVLTFDTPQKQKLRGLAIDPVALPELIPAELGFELVYAASPTQTVFCPPARLSVDNSLGWDAGSDVDVYLHGVDVVEEFAPYGDWAKVASARVNDDGSMIETTDGLPVLGVLGFKRR